MKNCLNLVVIFFFVLITFGLDLLALENDSSVEKIKGRWQRTDSNYIIAIEDVATDGKLKAFYFNPKSITVAKGQATQEDGVIKITIELRDVNYPGSTYNLHYDAVLDRLVGTYFQAVTKETYDIFFLRSATTKAGSL